MTDPTLDRSMTSEDLSMSPVAVPPSPVQSERTTHEAEQPLEQTNRWAAELRQVDTTDTSVRSRWPKDFCLSIIVPVYNEERTIQEMLERLVALDVPKQVIVVDDGSTDGTRNILAGWHHRREVELVLKPCNEGKGASLRTGFARVAGNLVVVQDADLEYDPADIESLVAPIINGEADVVYGSRFLKRRHSGSSFVHRVGNGLLTAFSNVMTGLRLTDMETCYKVFPAKLLRELEIHQNGFGIEPEITAKLARRQLIFAEVPIAYHARDWQDGKKIGFRDAFQAIYCIFRYAWRD